MLGNAYICVVMYPVKSDNAWRVCEKGFVCVLPAGREERRAEREVSKAGGAGICGGVYDQSGAEVEVDVKRESVESVCQRSFYPACQMNTQIS